MKPRPALLAFLILVLFWPGAPLAFGQQPPPHIMERLEAGESQELLVLLDDSRIEQEAAAKRGRDGAATDSLAVRSFKARRFKELKQRVLGRFSKREVELVKDYSHLPMFLGRFHGVAALERVLGQAEVLAVYENQRLVPHLNESLPLVGQPVIAEHGYGGAGVAVAVIDTGVNYTLADFGYCTSPGTPAGCRVVQSVDIAAADGSLDDSGHGSNVAGIVVGVAPQADIVSLDVFEAGASSDALVIEAINWAIANQEAFGIAALNLSLGNGGRYTAPCGDRLSNPYVVPVANAKAAGILTVASSGNEAFTDGISRPACTPEILSVGAVYDADVGGLAWSVCTDYTTKADQVSCFSNSASFLTLLAPGAIIDAAGFTMGGTSQAAPHVAGSVAVLRSAYPHLALDEAVFRLTGTGRPVLDSRNNIETPRLDVAAALGPYEFEEIPMLPGWGLAGFISLLLGVSARAGRRR